MTGTNGVDMSQYQAGNALRSFTGLDFCIAKATEGTTVKDPTYNQWASEAEELGIAFGAYHFFHAENLNADAQADMFCAYARPRNGLMLWLDYETWGASGEVDAQEIALFTDTVRLNVPEAKVGIYTNGTGLARILPYRHTIQMAALWYADNRPMLDQGALLGWEIHQYEVLNGVDRDYSKWTRAQMDAYAAW